MGESVEISVVMPVFLGEYTFMVHRNASNGADKFMRSVNSFINQTLKNSELIIISDGDDRAEDIWERQFSSEPRTRFKKIEKQELYSGVTRQTGLEMAIGKVVCYLDHDDMFGPVHLETIYNNFDLLKYDWVYYDDYLVRSADFQKIDTRNVRPERNIMGTSSFAHKRDIPVVWGNNNTHDFDLVEKYLLYRPSIKIPTPQYYVCHCSGLKMDF